MPGKSYIERINLNGRILFTVTSNPNGVLPGNAGDFALRTDAPNGTVYVNVDGALLWVDLTAMAATSPWTRVGTNVQLVVGTDPVGIGTPTPSTKLHVDSLAASTVPVLTLANLASDWQDFVGSGSPEGIVTASRGDTFHDDLGNLWLKVTGDATNTGWQRILTAADGPFWQQGGNSYGALGVFGTNDAFAVAFRTSGLEKMRLLTTGQLILGNTVPVGSELLRVDGGARFDDDVVIGGDLVVQGTTVSVDAETVLVADNHLYLNNGYTVPVAQTGGLVVNFLPLATTDTVGVGGFTAGEPGPVPPAANPFVITVGAGTFALPAGQFIQVSGTGPDPDFPINDGLYEVLSHVGTKLEIRGVGITGTVEDFTQNQFTTDATVAGTITHVTVSVSRAGLDGKWEVGQGSVTPVVFTDLSTVGSDGWTDDGLVVRLTTATDQVGVGTAAPAAGVKMHVVEDGVNRGIRSDVGAAADLAFQSRLVGDLFPRFDVSGLGYLFGGSGAAGVDVLLRRALAGVPAWENRNAADAAYINMRGADSVIDDDFVTRRQLTSSTAGAARWGNVCFVDQVFGNNATAARNGLPFLTITAALAAALAGDVVYVLPGTYPESVTVPDGVALIGLDQNKCIVDRTGIGVATDIVTMGRNCVVEALTLQGSTAAAVQLRAVVFTGAGSEATSEIRHCHIGLTHTGAGTCVGIEFRGAGAPTAIFSCVEDCEIVVTGSGAQSRRGLLVSNGGTSPIVESSLVQVVRTGAAVGTYYAVEVSAGAGASILLRGGLVQGPTGAGGADISQTLGTIILNSATLGTVNANNLGFTAQSGTYTEWCGDLAAQPAGGPARFFRSGTNTVQATELLFEVRSPRIARAIIVRSRIAPGGAQSSEYTLRKNAAVPATPLTTSLTNLATSNSSEIVSTGYVAGDTYSIQEVNSATAGTTDVQIGIEWYVGG